MPTTMWSVAAWRGVRNRLSAVELGDPSRLAEVTLRFVVDRRPHSLRAPARTSRPAQP